jgi:hypothetical protein
MVLVRGFNSRRPQLVGKGQWVNMGRTLNNRDKNNTALGLARAPRRVIY